MNARARAGSTLFALSRGLDFPQPVPVLVNHAFLAALANLEKRARELALQPAVSFSMNCEVEFHGLTFGKTEDTLASNVPCDTYSLRFRFSLSLTPLTNFFFYPLNFVSCVPCKPYLVYVAQNDDMFCFPHHVLELSKVAHTLPALNWLPLSRNTFVRSSFLTSFLNVPERVSTA